MHPRAQYPGMLFLSRMLLISSVFGRKKKDAGEDCRYNPSFNIPGLTSLTKKEYRTESGEKLVRYDMRISGADSTLSEKPGSIRSVEENGTCTIDLALYRSARKHVILDISPGEVYVRADSGLNGLSRHIPLAKKVVPEPVSLRLTGNRLVLELRIDGSQRTQTS